MFTGRLILWSSASFFFLFPLSAILHRTIETSLPHESVQLNVCDQQESRGMHQPGGSDMLGICLQEKQISPSPGSAAEGLMPPYNPSPVSGCPHYMGKAQDKTTPPSSSHAEPPWGTGNQALGKYIGKFPVHASVSSPAPSLISSI